MHAAKKEKKGLEQADWSSGFVAILVPLWVLGTKGESHDIWTGFDDLSGWGSSEFDICHDE